MKNLINKLIFIVNIFIIASFFPFSVNAEKGKINDVNKTKIVNDETFFDGEEETVIISIVNFGRKNPFEPYVKPTKIVPESKKIIKMDDIPMPPAYEGEASEEITELMNCKVNGILYDPQSTSVAIVNIKESEYMLHEGDIVAGIKVIKINKNSVTLKYGQNSYTVAVGTEVETSEEIKYDQVERSKKVFAGSNYDLPTLPTLNLEE
ncbi:MAG TPA: hypothetical protein P5556_03530 [Candidatus Gastranaerophilales bacterium]|nr:hypothetical protein [Candidatus Gastranaerophilales bacterium]